MDEEYFQKTRKAPSRNLVKEIEEISDDELGTYDEDSADESDTESKGMIF